MTPNAGILTHLLQAFLTVFDGGWGALRPSAMSLFGILVGIELTLSGLWWALSGDDAIKGLIQKILLIGLFFFFIQQWQMLSTTTMQSFARAGATAGNASAAPGSIDLSDPSAIVEMGFTAIQPLSDKVDAMTSGAWTTLKNLGTLMQMGLAMLGILFSFFLLGIQCFLVYIEFYIVAILSLILLPFGVFRHTAFMAEKAFGAVIAHGIKLMVLAFVIAIAQPVLQQITMPVDFSMRDAWCTLLAAMTICFLAWHAPGIAAGLLAGSPTLSAGHAASAALETGGVLALAARGRRVSSAPSSEGAVHSTMKAASALATGASLGVSNAAKAGAGPLGQAIGAVSGAAKVASSPVTSAVKSGLEAGRDAAKKVHAGESASGSQAADSARAPDSPAADGASSSRPTPTPSAASSASPTGVSPSRTTPESSSPASVTSTANRRDSSEGVTRTNADAAQSPHSSETLDAARIAPGQRRLDDVQGDLSVEGTHRAAAGDATTDPVMRAAKATPSDETSPSGEPLPKSAESPSPKSEE